MSDDLLRVEVRDETYWGWLYAYLRAPIIREIMKSTEYGHIIKHLETHHLNKLPVIVPPDPVLLETCTALAERLIEYRNEAYRKNLDAEELFDAQFPSSVDGRPAHSFIRRASTTLFSHRRRFDAFHHNPKSLAIEERLRRHSQAWTTLREANCEIWFPNRFNRIPAKDGTYLVGSSEIFELNPDIGRSVSAAGISDPNGGFVKPGWLMMSRSGQIYGLIGSVTMATHQHIGKLISDHVLRIVPGEGIPAGYLYVALGHPNLGRARVKTLACGSSVPCIEVEDLKDFPIPRVSTSIENEIGSLAEAAFSRWAEADAIEQQLGTIAESALTKFIEQSPILSTVSSGNRSSVPEV